MATAPAAAHSSVGQTVRRFIVFVLLFILVTIAASGLGGLLARVIDGGVLLIDDDTIGLATSLAFTLIAGPLAAVLWWFTWRGLSARVERDAVLWGLYLAGMSTLALVLWVVFVLSALSTLVSGDWDARAFSSGIVWAGVWVWHRWMSLHPTKSPTRLAGVARVLGYVVGIVVGTIAAVQLIAKLVDLAVGPPTSAASVGYQWWEILLQSAVWAVGGIVVWWLHWVLDRAARIRSGLATVMLVLVAGLLSVGLTIGGLATVAYVALRLAFERDMPVTELLDPLGFGLGAASVGAVLWSYHRAHLLRAQSNALRGARLLGAGVALAAAATGVGIVVNSILAAIVAPLAESDSRSLLFAGLSLVIVGGPAWWLIWKPLAPVTGDLAREAGRKVYLITVFGVSALVAIITLLVIGYQLFEFALSAELDASLLDRIRASLGLLIATALVAAYHFSVWRADRARAPAETARPQSISRVVLVTGPEGEPAARAIRDATGATVTTWTRSDQPTATPADELVAALAGVSGSRVLIVTSADGVQVIPLEG